MSAEARQKRRESAERWKNNNYEYWLLQKRALSCREEYKEHRRNLYKIKMDMLRSSNTYVPPTIGRPRIYSPEEALLRKRASAKNWAATHRSTKIISTMENDQQNGNASETASS